MLIALIIIIALAAQGQPCTPPDTTDLMVDDKGAYIVPGHILKARGVCARKP